jgi:hypothetical protein
MEQYSGPIWVTLIYIGLYYAFMSNVLRKKIRLKRDYAEKGKTFDRYFSQDREMLAADRTLLNMLEHMPVFLVLFWLHVLVVSPIEATILGAIYTGTRAVYPFLLGSRIGRDIPFRVLYVTFIGYFILLIFMVRITMNIL